MRSPPDAGRGAARAGTSADEFAGLLEAFAASPDVVLVLSLDGRVEAIGRALGEVAPEAAVGRPLASILDGAYAEALGAAIAEAARGGAARLDVVPGGGASVLSLGLSAFVRDGVAIAIVGVATDVTERRRDEERLRRAEALMSDAQGTAQLGTWEWDPREPHASWSDELYRIYGVTRDEYVPSYEGYLARVHPDDRAHVMAATERVFREHRPYSHGERIVRPDGSIRYLHTWAHAIVDGAGQLVRLIGVCQDVTDRKLAELALEQRALDLARSNELLRREMGERARIESLLRRAQRLEAIGRLTGGIAHDFNNVLGVVMGYADVLYKRSAPDAPERAKLAAIVSAAERGARLTQQLLAFGSDRAIERGPLEIDQVVSDLAELVRRLIGERVELVLDLRGSAPDGSAPCVDANRSQIEQVLMNLAVNARDAMPRGGTLTIATELVELDGAGDEADPEGLAPGSYVRLVVSDTGVGMSDETQAHVFDPFFTTKAPGQGTGLGLSTVYGIVKQSGGAIVVASAPGAGTRVTITLGRAASATPRVAPGGPSDVLLHGSETILVVDDQEAIREVVRESLESFGYTVLTTSDPEDALARAACREAAVHALIADVVMPRMSGPELAERALATRPDLCVLYMSGHTSDDVLREGSHSRRIALVQKPFTPGELARRLRETLDG